MSDPGAAGSQKKAAALAAVVHVESGMTVGLGTGSTAKYAILELARRLAAGELTRVSGVPTSLETAALAREHGIPVVELSGYGVDVAIDGMDEVTECCDAIKGLGGALTREKIVASRARLFILAADESKLVTRLGEKAPLPVEVLQFGWRAVLTDLGRLGCEAIPRQREGELFVSDNGHYILDLHFGRNFPAQLLAAELPKIPGVIEHGLFLGIAQRAYIATDKGVQELRR